MYRLRAHTHVNERAEKLVLQLRAQRERERASGPGWDGGLFALSDGDWA
jgi:hypothetical protein